MNCFSSPLYLHFILDPEAYRMYHCGVSRCLVGIGSPRSNMTIAKRPSYFHFPALGPFKSIAPNAVKENTLLNSLLFSILQFQSWLLKLF